MASQNGRESKDGLTQGGKSGSSANGAPQQGQQQQQQEHSCEICGMSGLSDDAMRDHTRQYHVEGSPQCPFCGLSGAPEELLFHVNQAHLDYLTPENELMSFIDDQTPSVDGDSDSISDCRGLSPSITSELLTPMSSSGMKAGFNGSTTTTITTTTSSSNSGHGMMLTSGSGSFTTISSNTGSYSNHQQASSHQPGLTQTHHNGTNGAPLIGKMIGSSLTAASSSCMSSSRSSLGSSSTNLCNGLPNGTTSAGHSSNGKSTNQHYHFPDVTNASGSNGSIAGETHTNGAAATGGTSGPVMNGGGAGCTTPAGAGAGGQGSPLRSQLGLKLKSHKPNSFSIAATGTEVANGGPEVKGAGAICPATMTITTTATTITTKQASPLQCLLCPYTSDNPTVLEEHINRSHFDPLSPSVNGAGGGGGPGGGGAAGGSGQHVDTLSVLQCPICNRTFESGSDLELHVNIEHRDILSPAKADSGRATNGTPSGAAAHNGSYGGGSSSLCPVCGISFDHMKTQDMEYHIEKHFSKSPQNPYQGGAVGGGGGNHPSGVAVDLEKQAQKLREQREFEMLRAQYGMDDQGNFREQSAAAMQRAVYAGEMSVADYYERQVGLRAAESHGVDDGSSCTKSVSPRVLSLSSSAPNVIKTYVCSSVDHYASSYGDKGWGCGYRNLQMILSSLLQNTSYNEALYSAWGSHGPARTAMPSISRLQRMVEAAWAQGFDIQGSEQLGCKLYNTRKWIGATEIVTVLSWLRIRCELVDFHRPTSADGRHPELFNWVLRYFEEPRIHTPPLYLQHQGHSRTIIGIEQRTSGLSLLVLDPSHGPRQVAALGSSQDSLRLIRKNSTAMRAPQYQVVAVKGLIDTEDQYQASKVLKSLRIPPDR
ncbi:zinc finger-containing ubiquitin peptidase 1-like isoform X2 [Anopheles moucheti]|uniref:zinc finger-containing ubiquitin peptidase 1-like isoform X2 n=1 Tax=Anopheles moucheti TaxID=186751 RepID=UPI0022F0D049|nr:zinc finger-containing ubiquitin peptidase 1-like isoform X2 [Anopheles moucheti]